MVEIEDIYKQHTHTHAHIRMRTHTHTHAHTHAYAHTLIVCGRPSDHHKLICAQTPLPFLVLIMLNDTFHCRRHLEESSVQL